MELAKYGGNVAYITARYFLESTYGPKFRMFCTQKSIIKSIVDFGNFQVFDANVLTIIIVLEKGMPSLVDNNVKILKYDEISKEISLLPPHNGFKNFKYFSLSFPINLGTSPSRIMTN